MLAAFQYRKERIDEPTVRPQPDHMWPTERQLLRLWPVFLLAVIIGCGIGLFTL
jgi:hypothetical protein